MKTSIKITGAMPRKNVASAVVAELKKAFALFITSVRDAVSKAGLTPICDKVCVSIDAIKATLPSNLDIDYNLVGDDNLVKLTVKLKYFRKKYLNDGCVPSLQRSVLQSEKVFEITIHL